LTGDLAFVRDYGSDGSEAGDQPFSRLFFYALSGENYAIYQIDLDGPKLRPRRLSPPDIDAVEPQVADGVLVYRALVPYESRHELPDRPLDVGAQLHVIRLSALDE
jgi:hypothetical protein